MKKKILPAAFACVSLTLFVACGSTPDAQTEPVQEVPVAEETPVIEAEPEVPAENFDEADAALLAAVEKSRDLAHKAGAAELNPAAFGAAETEYEAARTAIAGGSGNDLSGSLKDLNNRYLALAAAADAKAKKARIDSEGLASYNQRAYDNGSRKLEEVLSPESALLSGADQLKNAKAANESFDAVLADAFRALAKDARKKAVAAKKNADSVKAAVSRKADYEKSVKLVKDGDALFVTGGAEQSVSNYNKAAESFTKLFNEISEKRAEAQKAIEAAKARVAQSELNAAAADAEVPLGDQKVEGIEDEDAQLLEADDFSAQENSVVEISDDIEVTAGGDAK